MADTGVALRQEDLVECARESAEALLVLRL